MADLTGVATVLWLGVLGPLLVRRDDGEVIVGAPMARQLLANLVAGANRAVSSDALVDDLWPGDGVAARRKALQVLIHRLRRSIGTERITHRSGAYVLLAGPDECDALRFVQLLAQGRAEREAGNLIAAEKALVDAVGLWRGEPYADIAHSPRIVPEVQRLAEARLLALEEKAGVELMLGRDAELVADLRALVAANPFREVLIGHLMLALHRSGRQAEALGVFRRAREDLVEQLGVEPGTDLQELHHALLRGTADAPSPAVPAIRVATPRMLPYGVADFSGREEQLAELDRLVSGRDDPISSPLIISAIAGTAGVGKTALALHWAHRVADRFPDGQLYLNLHGYSANGPLRPIEAITSILLMVGVPCTVIPAGETEAAAFFRSALSGRRMLIVLDNARSAEQVRPLLPGSPGALALITSRSALSDLVAYDGARRIRLDVLSAAEADTLLRRMLGGQRVDAEPDAARELATLCAHLPLALRVAATNLADHPGRGIAQHVADLRGRALSALSIDGERPSIRAAFDLSYRAEASDVQRTFRLLGLVPGPDVSAPAVAALTGVSIADAEIRLGRLAAAHLIQRAGTERYTFHDLLRLYARERLVAEEPAEEQQRAMRRLVMWYLTVIDAAATVMYPNVLRAWKPGPEVPDAGVTIGTVAQAAGWLDTERRNILATIERTSIDGPKDGAWLLADAVRGYLGRRGDPTGWFAAAEAAISAARDIGDRRGQASAHLNRAYAEYSQGAYERAQADLRIAITLSRQSGWAEYEATCLGNLGAALCEQGLPQQAVEMQHAALALAARLHMPAMATVMGNNLGYALLQLGRPAEAVDALQQAARRQDSAGLATHLLSLLDNLGMASNIHGDTAAAVELLQRSTVSHDGRDAIRKARSLMHLAVIHHDAGDLTQAHRIADTVHRAAREFGDPRNEARALLVIGMTLLEADAARAATSFETAVAALAGNDVRLTRAQLAFGRSASHLALGDPGGARAYAGQALDAAQRFGYRILEGQVLTLFARINLASGDVAGAATSAMQAAELCGATEHHLGEVHATRLVSAISRQLGDRAGAEAATARADRIAATLDTLVTDRLLIGVT